MMSVGMSREKPPHLYKCVLMSQSCQPPNLGFRPSTWLVIFYPCPSVGQQMDIFISSFSFITPPTFCFSLVQKMPWGGRGFFAEYVILFSPNTTPSPLGQIPMFFHFFWWLLTLQDRHSCFIATELNLKMDFHKIHNIKTMHNMHIFVNYQINQNRLSFLNICSIKSFHKFCCILSGRLDIIVT